MSSMQYAIIASMTNVQVRGVPDDVHRRLKSQAALSGQSLNEFLLARLTDIARVPTLAELSESVGLTKGTTFRLTVSESARVN